MSTFKYYSLVQDFRQNKWVVSLLCFGMLPLWLGGYCGYVLIFLFPILFKSKYDFTSFCVIVFSLTYTMNQTLQGGGGTMSVIIFNLLFPIIIFQTAKYLVSRFSCPISNVILLSCMGISLALPAIFGVILDTIETKELINVSRSIIDSGDEASRSATGYGMMLAAMCGCLGLLLIQTNNNLDNKVKYILIIVCVLSLFSTIHLLNRTGLFLGGISVVLAIFNQPLSKRKFTILIVTFSVLLLIISYLSDYITFLDEAFKFYEERNEGSGNIEEGGGRTSRWMDALHQILSQPMGNPKGFFYKDKGIYNYAHNMILDGGIKGGILCFLVLIYFAGRAFISAILCTKQTCLSHFESWVVFLITVSVLLQNMTEPVIEGLPQLFWYFIFLVAMIPGIIKKYPRAIKEFRLIKQ